MRPSLVVTVLLMLSAPVHGSVVEALDLTALTALSDRVVRARVVDAESAWDTGQTRIHTRYTLEVEDTVLGPPGERLVLFQWGGTVGEIGQRVLGEAELHVGMRAVFFLESVDHHEGQGTFRTVGLAQGVWPVVDDPLGGFQVGRSAAPLTVRMTGQQRGSTVMLPDRGAARRSYVDLRAEIRRLARRTR